MEGYQLYCYGTKSVTGMVAMTTSSSTSVKARFGFIENPYLAGS